MVIEGKIKQKIILLLIGGLALGLSTSPRSQKRIFRELKREWNFINRQKLYRNIKVLEKQKMIRYAQKGKWWSVELTEKGKKYAEKIGFDKLSISSPENWDRKWRIVIFDIPENKKIVRDALRKKIQDLGFKELQKSVFVHPYPCLDEINIVVKFFKSEEFVKQFIATDFDKHTEKKLRKIFNI